MASRPGSCAHLARVLVMRHETLSPRKALAIHVEVPPSSFLFPLWKVLEGLPEQDPVDFVAVKPGKVAKGCWRDEDDAHDGADAMDEENKDGEDGEEAEDEEEDEGDDDEQASVE